MSKSDKIILIFMFLILPITLLAYQSEASLHPLCADCHKQKPNMLMGFLYSFDPQANTLQLDVFTHKEILKYDSTTKLKNLSNFSIIGKYRREAFAIYYAEKNGEKFATTIERFEVFRTLKPNDALTLEELKKLIAEKNNIVIIDTRPIRKYEEKHIPGSINIPIDSFDKYINKLPEKKDTPLVFYCVIGCASAKAVAKAKSLGYRNVKAYIEGINRWTDESYTHTTAKWLKYANEKEIPYIYIDTRPNNTTNHKLFKNAIYIIGDETDSVIKEKIPKDYTLPVVLEGDNSIKIAQKLIYWGYKDVRVLPKL
jgi:rhodanese-related sulfurtransferase